MPRMIWRMLWKGWTSVEKLKKKRTKYVCKLTIISPLRRRPIRLLHRISDAQETVEVFGRKIGFAALC